MNFRIGASQRPATGQTECGDAYKVHEGRATTIALADGLGHGPPAAEAARAFCELACRHVEAGLQEVFRLATRTLGSTIGAAAAVVLLDPDGSSLAFAGVGNVELRAASRHPIHPVCTPGIVGRPVRKITEYRYPIQAGDLLVLYTDGIRSRFDLEPLTVHPATEMARQIVRLHGREYDDCTCVVVRCE